MRTWFACLVVVSALLAGATALACGAPYGDNISVDPHQDIIVVWKDGVETYAFQPTFCGTATDFGLILPVAAPLSENPTIIEQQAFATSATLSEPNKRQVVEHGGTGCGGMAANKGGVGGVMDDTPAVVASGRVGLLDWTLLKAETEASFTDWLTANGYPYSSGDSSVFAYYVSKGWYFLAFRISQEAAPAGTTICRSLGPVALSFPTPAPVVPSHMASGPAGTNGTYSPVTWRIFGITHGDVQLAFSEDDYRRRLWYSGAIKDADLPAFGGLAQAGDRLTRLTLSFYKGELKADVGLTVSTAQDYRGTQDVVVYDDGACSVRPGGQRPQSCLLSLFGLALLGLFCWRRWR
jgi:hypothetical protein